MKSPFKADFKHTPRFAYCETQDFKISVKKFASQRSVAGKAA